MVWKSPGSVFWTGNPVRARSRGLIPAGWPRTYACEVPLGDGTDGTFNADKYMEPKEQRKVDTFILFGMAAAQQAIEDSGWMPKDREDLERTGVMIGSGIGGLNSIAQYRRDDGGKRPAPRVAVLCAGRADQPDFRSGVDQIRLPWAEPRGCHRLFHRRACDW